MILKASVLVIGLVGAVLSASIDCNIEQCAKPTKFYEELGCKAVFGAKSCCAKRFECPDFKALDDNKCTFDGKQYSIGEILPRGEADTAKCIETCFCTRDDNGPAKFTCSKNDCGVSSFKVPGCINIYGDLNECCSTSVVCDDEEKASLASCFVGKEYREGEKFVPASNPCYECLCHKDFDNTTIADNPHCRKLNCEIDLRYKSFVQRGCLPVFTSEKCCPVDWECPKADRKVVKRSADGDESTHAPKQEVFVVTPSKNMQEYLDIVKLNNAGASEEHSAIVTEALKESTTTTTAAPIPTLSSDPFQAPHTEPTVAVVVKVDETTTPIVKVLADLVHTDSTAAPAVLVTLPPVETTTPPPPPSLANTEATSPVPTTLAATSETASTTVVVTEATTTTAQPTTTTAESTTTVTTTTAKSEDSDESKESGEEEDENKNLFGDEVDDDEILPTKIFETTTEAMAESSVSTTEATTTSASTTTAALTSATPKDEPLKVLSPDEPITVVQTSTSEPTTATAESTTAKAPATEIFIVTEPTTVPTTPPTTQQSFFAKASESIYDLFPQVSIVKTPEAKSLETPETAPRVVVVTAAPSSAVPETTTTTQAPSTVPTFSENVAPTAFEELLSTLKKFVAKIESTSVKPEEIKPETTPEPLPTLPVPIAQPVVTIVQELTKPVLNLAEAPLSESAQVEFVNFTVSTHNEGPKVISKRSAPAADLIPQYFKQHYSISKDKGCVFNSKTYKLGEVIKTSNECLKCICEYAPIGHCMLKEKCNF